MESSFWNPVAASVIAGLVTATGIFAVRWSSEWAHRNAIYFASFAAGVLVTVSFAHIVPKALAMNPQAPWFLLGGYLALLAFNSFVTTHVCNEPQTADYGLGLVPLLGIGLHSFLDGVVYSVSFGVSAITGLLASLGMVLHEFPEGVVTYVLLLKGGFSRGRSLLFALLAASFTTPLGTLLSYPVVSRIDVSLLGALLGLSAGALVYVGATHLLPRVERERRSFSLVAFGGGVLVAVGIATSGG